MSDKKIRSLSKFLSYCLRHNPDKIGLKLDSAGWAKVDAVLSGMEIDMATLEYMVDNNNKNRYSFNYDKTKVRANQGHSVEVNLGLLDKRPPRVLYHGTAEKSQTAILAQGITKQSRHAVHLSADTQTATDVGKRHGKPVVFRVDAARMYDDGIKFQQSANGVWLTKYVDAKYLTLGGETQIQINVNAIDPAHALERVIDTIKEGREWDGGYCPESRYFDGIVVKYRYENGVDNFTVDMII